MRILRASRSKGAAITCLMCACCMFAAGCSLAPKAQEKNGYKELAGIGQQTPDYKPPPTIDPTQVETRDDIFAIMQYWPQVPFLNRNDEISGFKVAVYFLSTATQHGAFVNGPITVSLFRIDRTQAPSVARQLAYQWVLDEQLAMPYRVTRHGIMGYPYQFMLAWPPELSVAGKDVEIVFSYTRADGRVVNSATKKLRVPVPVGYTPPGAQARS